MKKRVIHLDAPGRQPRGFYVLYVGDKGHWYHQINRAETRSVLELINDIEEERQKTAEQDALDYWSFEGNDE